MVSVFFALKWPALYFGDEKLSFNELNQKLLQKVRLLFHNSTGKKPDCLYATISTYMLGVSLRGDHSSTLV